MRFRPCIDLHDGQVKQIVGATLSDDGNGLQTNFVAGQPPSYFAEMYHADGLRGGHVIMLGPNNEAAARDALGAHPGELQVGGGINPSNARQWLEAGAGQVIVTSWMFADGEFSLERLQELAAVVKPEELVLDLSCRKDEDNIYRVTCNRWQKMTSLAVDRKTMTWLAEYCAEFLIHAVAVEGRQSGIDLELVELLADCCPCPVTYAGGIRSLDDIALIDKAGQGRIDFTVGSALDIFGGSLLKYRDLVAWK